MRVIECVILRYHTPLQLNVYGRALQVSKFTPPVAAAASAAYALYMSGRARLEIGHSSDFVTASENRRIICI